MSNIYKILFTGPVGSGKTTAIQSLSDIGVVSTGASASDDVKSLKPTTTVAVDYGLMKLPNGDQVRLYGTACQKRLDFSWDILARESLGLVLMRRASAPTPVDGLRPYASECRQLIAETSLVVGMTHTDRGGMHARQKVARAL